MSNNQEAPGALYYTPTHEWVRVDESDSSIIYVGITDHAQCQLGDIVYISLPTVGQSVSAGEHCAVIESVKAASDIYAPLSGQVIAVNDELRNETDLINKVPYTAWMFKIKLDDTDSIDHLMDAQEYNALI